MTMREMARSRAATIPGLAAMLLTGLMLATLTPTLSLAQPPTASAVPTRQEEVVVTASVEPQAFDALARAVHRLLRAEIERLGLDSVADALRLFPGVDPRARGPRDVQTDFALRGATFGQGLMLVDGWRINDSQSAHHNGDIPVPAVAIERIEVLAGSGSAVHGADALGGAINVITRRDPHQALNITFGDFGYTAAQASASGGWLPETWTVAGWGSRSSGFMFDRDFSQGGLMIRGAPGLGWTVDARHQRKAFGANGFYGRSPSKEWTDQSLAGLGWQGALGAWTAGASAMYRNHGDHFLWDIARPGFAENRHRTHAVGARVTASRPLPRGGAATVGASGGSDRVRSSNLGNHDYEQVAAFAEVRVPFASRGTLQASARLDAYSSFGRAWSPSVSAGLWVAPTVRLRGSVSRAFRIPTYTELYYRDPAHQALADLRPERAWSLDGGFDWTPDGRWLITASLFRRWDDDVIDWVKAAQADRWNTTNVRDVTSTGVEVGLNRTWREVMIRASASSQAVNAPTLSLLSKYVLEYARHSVGGAIAVPAGLGIRLAVTADHRRRFQGPAYTLVGVRLAKRLGRIEGFVGASNLLNEDYYEVKGVEMPGRWVTAGVAIR